MQHPSRVAMRLCDAQSETEHVAIPPGIERLPRIGDGAVAEMARKTGGNIFCHVPTNPAMASNTRCGSSSSGVCPRSSKVTQVTSS